MERGDSARETGDSRKRRALPDGSTGSVRCIPHGGRVSPSLKIHNTRGVPRGVMQRRTYKFTYVKTRPNKFSTRKI